MAWGFASQRRLTVGGVSVWLLQFWDQRHDGEPTYVPWDKSKSGLSSSRTSAPCSRGPPWHVNT